MTNTSLLERGEFRNDWKICNILATKTPKLLVPFSVRFTLLEIVYVLVQLMANASQQVSIQPFLAAFAEEWISIDMRNSI